MDALGFELFIRSAFGNVERGGDPAGLAEADNYNMSYSPEYFYKVKIAAGYAIAIFNRKYNNSGETITTEQDAEMNEFLRRTIEAETTRDINMIIEDYRNFMATMPAI